MHRHVSSLVWKAVTLALFLVSAIIVLPTCSRSPASKLRPWKAEISLDVAPEGFVKQVGLLYDQAGFDAVIHAVFIRRTEEKRPAIIVQDREKGYFYFCLPYTVTAEEKARLEQQTLGSQAWVVKAGPLTGADGRQWAATCVSFWVPPAERLGETKAYLQAYGEQIARCLQGYVRLADEPFIRPQLVAQK